MNFTESDCNLPPIYPFTGKLSNHGYTNTLEVLHGLFCSNKLCILRKQDIVECIRINVSLCKPSVVKNKKNGLKYVNVFKRNSRSVTFNHNIVEEITNEILPGIKSHASSLPIQPEQIIIDQSHGDILYYEDECFFSEHRDQVNIYPAEIKVDEQKRWRMYSLIISLDSNIIDSYEGATKIHLPSRSWILDAKRYYHPTHDGKKMISHIFTQSCRPMHWVIFPAEALHSSVEINRGNNLYKLALKLDLWLKIPQLESEKILLLSKRSYTDECTCDRCDTRQYRVEQAVLQITDILRMFHHNILLLIAGYGIGDDSTVNRKECICNKKYYEENKSIYENSPDDKECQCTCSECYDCD